MRAFIGMLGAGAAIGLLLPTAHRSSEPLTASVATSAAHETLLERSNSGHFYVDGDVNDQIVHFVVDTGADTVALTVDDARRVGLTFSESEFQPIARSASGTIMGKEVVLDSIAVDGKIVPQVRALICSGLDVSLLGQTYLARIGAIQMNGDYMTLS